MTDPAALAPTPSPRPAVVYVVARWPQRLLAEMLSYLPLLLMALLALGTWWLVSNTPLAEPERALAPPRHEPDYTMSQFLVQRFAADGELRAQIEGETMRHYPDTDTLEIDNVRVRAVAPDGRVTTAHARMAHANADGSEVQLRGGARVVREGASGEAPMVFRGEFIHAFLDTERLRSHLPVTMTQGGTELHAQALEYDHGERVVQLKGRVTATFPAAAGRGSP